ncbi:hypothetical protein [Streptomyces sp. NBC_01506]|uniref:hypothetical protein n=1 Tax=Streptomyces sp. NBC_01506 TaxID=2903887 RepID=UPI003864E167
MTTRTNTLRLLPWTSDEGKPCFLSADGDGGVMSRLADSVEASQTSTGTEVLGGARAVLADPKVGSRELRFALARVTEVLGDVLRVAESRGARLSAPGEYEDEEDLEDLEDDGGEGDG